MVYVMEDIDKQWDENLADELFNKIMEQVDNFFNS
jgi:hypothetical protein